MHTRTPKGEVGVVERTPRDEVVEQQYQPCLTLVKAAAQTDPLLQYGSRLYGIDESVDKLRQGLLLEPISRYTIQHSVQSSSTWAFCKNITALTGATQLLQRHPCTRALHGLQEFYIEILGFIEII